jgi:hypothetical protein
VPQADLAAARAGSAKTSTSSGKRHDAGASSPGPAAAASRTSTYARKTEGLPGRVAGGAAERADADLPPADPRTPAPVRSPLAHYYELSIWQILPVVLFYEAERSAAKAFAADACGTAAALLTRRGAGSAASGNTVAGRL